VIVNCQICGCLFTGPDAPIDVLDRDMRSAYEFAALYSRMVAHLRADHPDFFNFVVTLIDQYALAIVANVFGASDPTYVVMHSRVRSAVWSTLSSTWNSSLVGGDSQLAPPSTLPLSDNS
jgi:hypothetical protein